MSRRNSTVARGVGCWSRSSDDSRQRALVRAVGIYTPNGHRLAKATHTGRRESLRYVACGLRSVTLEVYRYRGFGRYRLRDDLPYTTRD